MCSPDTIQAVMEKIQEFYMNDAEDEGPSGEKIFNDFAVKHKDLFSGSFSEESEQKLEYTVAFKEYQGIFEKQIEKIITECDVSIQDFFSALKEEQENDPSVEFFVEMLLVVSDYSAFLLMMQDYMSKQKA